MEFAESGKKISKKQIIKFHKRASRELELEGPGRLPHKIHKTSKKDQHERSSNNVRRWKCEETP